LRRRGGGYTEFNELCAKPSTKNTFIRDSFTQWKKGGNKCASGKPIIVDPSYISIFFDDNALVTPDLWDKKNTPETERILKYKQETLCSHTPNTFGTANFRNKQGEFVECTQRVACPESCKVGAGWDAYRSSSPPIDLVSILVNDQQKCAVVNICYEDMLKRYYESYYFGKIYKDVYDAIISTLSGQSLPKHLHFDINKTIIPIDSIHSSESISASEAKMFPCFSMFYNAYSKDANTYFFFRSFGKDYRTVSQLLNIDTATETVVFVRPTDVEVYTEQLQAIQAKLKVEKSFAEQLQAIQAKLKVEKSFAEQFTQKQMVSFT
jgi:hypothetical protein